MNSHLLQVYQYDVVDGSGPLKDLVNIFLVAAVTARQIMRRLLRVTIRSVVTVMRGHVSESMKNIQCFSVIDDVHTFADILFGYAVVVLEKRDVAVTHDRYRFLLFHLVAYSRKRTQIAGLHLFEQLATGMLARRHAS